MSANEPDDTHYGLVMPFVVCKSHDGPLDDHAFVLGATFGQIDAALLLMEAHAGHAHLTAWESRWYVHPDLVPQLDLLAMHRSALVTFETWDEHPDEWVEAVFSPMFDPPVELEDPKP